VRAAIDEPPVIACARAVLRSGSRCRSREFTKARFFVAAEAQAAARLVGPAAGNVPVRRLLDRELGEPMKQKIAFALMLVTLPWFGAGPDAAASPESTVEAIRAELLQLPYYGVFDYLAFSYDRGTVTLVGYAYAPGLKKDAERAAKRAPGVDMVVNKIEELPPNRSDDEIRWATYYKIYRDPFLSRYAPGGAMLWGHRHAAGNPFYPFAGGLFPGMEPAGDYPIHIIVKNGRVTLLGVVDNESDKNVAGLRAREVPGTFAVTNELLVEDHAKS
jgi:hyperosmotically inducible protein